MSQEAEFVLTPRGHGKLEQRLDYLRNVCVPKWPRVCATANSLAT